MELVGDRPLGANGPLEYDPLDPVVKNEPYPYYLELRRNEPVKWLSTLNAFCVASYDDVDTVLKDGRTYSSCEIL